MTTFCNIAVEFRDSRPDCRSDCKSFSDRSVQTNRGSCATWNKQKDVFKREVTVEFSCSHSPSQQLEGQLHRPGTQCFATGVPAPVDCCATGGPVVTDRKYSQYTLLTYRRYRYIFSPVIAYIIGHLSP